MYFFKYFNSHLPVPPRQCYGSIRGSQLKKFITQGKREALKPKGLLVEFSKELSFRR